MKRLMAAVVAVVVLGGLAAACGGNKDAEAIDGMIRSFAAATTAGDVQAIAAAYTDKGLTEDQFGATREEFLASNPEDVKQQIEVTGVVARVDGDAATADVKAVFQDLLVFSGRVPLLKVDGEWKIDGGFEDLPVPIPDGVTPVDLQLAEFAFAWQPADVTTGNVAFRIENVGQQPHEAVLVKIADGVDLQQALFSEGEPQGIEFAGFATADPGESNTLVFTKPLDPGHYAFVCFFPDVNDPEMTPHAFKGMISEFDVPA